MRPIPGGLPQGCQPCVDLVACLVTSSTLWLTEKWRPACPKVVSPEGEEYSEEAIDNFPSVCRGRACGCTWTSSRSWLPCATKCSLAAVCSTPTPPSPPTQGQRHPFTSLVVTACSLLMWPRGACTKFADFRGMPAQDTMQAVIETVLVSREGLHPPFCNTG